VAAKPHDIPLLSSFGDFAEELDCLRLEAGFAGVIVGDDSVHLDSDDESRRLHQPGASDSLARNLHQKPSSKK